MFEVFTSTNTAEASINCDEALSIVGNTFLYLIKRGKDFSFLILYITAADYQVSTSRNVNLLRYHKLNRVEYKVVIFTFKIFTMHLVFTIIIHCNSYLENIV